MRSQKKSRSIKMPEIKTLSITEYLDLLTYIKKNIMVGVECERSIEHENSTVARYLKTGSGSYSSRSIGSTADKYKKASTNPFNVAFVYPDMTVSGGRNEIVFNGTAESFAWIHDKLLKLEKKLDELGCKDFCNTTSNHITLISLQDKLINPLVLVNLYNMVKAFSPAIYWLGSANDSSRIVRPTVNGFSDLKLINPLGKTFEELKEQVSRGMLNFQHQNIVSVGLGEEVLSGIRIEFRSPDGMRVPSALASLMFLFKSMLLKSVDLSTKGLVKTETLIDDWQEIKSLMIKIKSGFEMTQDDKSKVRQNAKELIEFVMPHLKTLAPESVPILFELAKKPISHRNRSWKVAEKELMKARCMKLTKNEERLIEIVIAKEISEQTTGKMKKKVAEVLGVTDRMVEIMIKNIGNKTNHRIVFDSEINTYRFE